MWKLSTGIDAQLKWFQSIDSHRHESMNWVRFVLLLTSFQDIVIVWGDYLIETEDGNYLVEANNIERDYNEAVYEASR